MWMFRFPDWLNALSHTWHLYGLSPVWTLMWLFRCPDWLNALSHTWHLYGLSPVWTVMCLFRFPDWLNALSHMWHLYGFSPLWVLLWLTRLSDLVNSLLQTVHSNGFCPEWLRLCLARSRLLSQQFPHSVHLYLLVWIFLCWDRLLGDEKRFSHWLQEYKCSPVCLLLWTVKYCFLVNRLSQTVQRYCFSPSFVLLWTFKLANICPSLVVLYVGSNVTTISFNLYFKRVPCTSKNHRQTLTDDKTYEKQQNKQRIEITFWYVVDTINHCVPYWHTSNAISIADANVNGGPVFLPTAMGMNYESVRNVA